MHITAPVAISVALSIASSAIAATPEQNATNARAFLETAFNEGKVQEAFATYIGANYKQHNPHVPDGKEASVKGLSTMMANIKGKMHMDIRRTIAQDDMVAVHSHSTNGQPGDRGSAVIDLFRFDPNGKIVEHWDVIQPVPAGPAANSNTMF